MSPTPQDSVGLGGRYMSLRQVPRTERVTTGRPRPFDPPLPVVIPPKLARPDIVLGRIEECLRTGRVKSGNRWSEELRLRLPDKLPPDEGRTVLATTSWTERLRLAVLATFGPAKPGDWGTVPPFS